MPDINMKVEDVMQTSIHMVSGLATVREAIVEMKQIGVSALIIERRDESDEYGIVSVEQIATKVIAQDRSVDRVSVYEIMDKPILTLNPHMAVKYAIRLLARFDSRRALVVDENGARGLVTLRELIHVHAETPASEPVGKDE
ncbi:CBS domain-containing protein [Alisedimentitalea sp. MJ-SS2]|uniref:CBS domain-containing protein n=1 Tax=Aliisedimentitalea sp. MJ-SS2 TaxID=3049795 RepID=UPI00290FBE05|nr:CBS domain-containing protein [Alisedimentitalea sp. MJ-SS2]MDU8929701.1 CBS domain-containing protein [Alisedimentitalea sp. MJ-SS2]